MWIQLKTEYNKNTQEFRKLENLPICKKEESYWITVSFVSMKDQTDYQCIIDMQTDQWEKCVE